MNDETLTMKAPFVRVLLESNPETGIHMRPADHAVITTVPIDVYDRWRKAEIVWTEAQREMDEHLKAIPL